MQVRSGRNNAPSSEQDFGATEQILGENEQYTTQLSYMQAREMIAVLRLY